MIHDNYKLINIDGLSNLTSVDESLNIINNYALTDLCGIKNILTINGVSGDISIAQNLYNPTVEDIIAGNCSQ